MPGLVVDGDSGDRLHAAALLEHELDAGPVLGGTIAGQRRSSPRAPRTRRLRRRVLLTAVRDALVAVGLTDMHATGVEIEFVTDEPASHRWRRWQRSLRRADGGSKDRCDAHASQCLAAPQRL